MRAELVERTLKKKKSPAVARTEKWNRFSCSDPEGTNPADTLISDFQPPELWENKLMLFQVVLLVRIYYGSPEKLVQMSYLRGAPKSDEKKMMKAKCNMRLWSLLKSCRKYGKYYSPYFWMCSQLFGIYFYFVGISQVMLRRMRDHSCNSQQFNSKTWGPEDMILLHLHNDVVTWATLIVLGDLQGCISDAWEPCDILSNPVPLFSIIKIFLTNKFYVLSEFLLLRLLNMLPSYWMLPMPLCLHYWFWSIYVISPFHRHSLESAYLLFHHQAVGSVNHMGC